ncbi:MAG: tRNA (adenosine(37)-N6)-threonylcarbamoyltransferase complex ATPase subunit type 1 TsaE [Rhodospirillales bacterium]
MTATQDPSPLLVTTLADEAATEAFGAALAPLLSTGDVLALDGTLGMGKTVLARGLARALMDEPDLEVPSPTFTLVQVYEGLDETLFHFDLYRLVASEEAYEAGIEDAFGDGISVIEWPDRLGGILPRQALWLQLTPAKEGRTLTVWGPPAWAKRLRPLLKRSFLQAAGWGDAEVTVLAGDASFRRYDRAHLAGERRVLMDAPPPEEDIRPFAAIARHLSGLGLSAPAILAENAGAGFLLLEDFGDDTYTRLLARGHDEKVLYERAVEALIHLHRHPEANALDLPAYDVPTLMREARLLVDWYAPAVLGEALSADPIAAFEAALKPAFDWVAEAKPKTLVLRDFHVDNLLLLPGRDGPAACGLLDFQDALSGHPAYDLMSLLEDARRDVDPDLQEACKARYFQAMPEVDKARFLTAYRILGAGRHAKVIGIFTRLAHRDGKPRYLPHIARCWRLLLAACEAEPLLADFHAWLDKNLPAQDRVIPDETP